MRLLITQHYHIAYSNSLTNLPTHARWRERERERETLNSETKKHWLPNAAIFQNSFFPCSLFGRASSSSSYHLSLSDWSDGRRMRVSLFFFKFISLLETPVSSSILRARNAEYQTPSLTWSLSLSFSVRLGRWVCSRRRFPPFFFPFF